MKKIYILMIAIFISGIAKAQIPILTQYNTVPVAGDTLISSSHNNDTIMPGLSGANIFWDFSNLNYTISSLQTFSGSIIVYNFTPSDIYYIYFSNATIVKPYTYDMNGFMRFYYQADNYGYYYLGSAGNLYGIGGILQQYLNSELIMKFPFTYLNSAIDTFKIKIFQPTPNPDLYRVHDRVTIRTIKADGWGNINIIGNMHTNVLRVKKLDSLTETSYWQANFPGFTDTTKVITKSISCTYEWYDGINKQPLMSIKGTQDTSQIFHPESFYITNAGIPSLSFSTYNSISENKNLEITLSPNPATNSLTLNLNQLKNLQNTTVSIYDIQGKLLLQQNINQPQTELDISGLAKGIYIIKVTNEKETMQSKFIKE